MSGFDMGDFEQKPFLTGFQPVERNTALETVTPLVDVESDEALKVLVDIRNAIQLATQRDDTVTFETKKGTPALYWELTHPGATQIKEEVSYE